MTEKAYRTNFVPGRLNLALFGLQRNRLKDSDDLYEHLEKQRTAYTRRCCEENLKTNAAKQKQIHVLGQEILHKYPCLRRPLRLNRDLIKAVDWQHAPNRYDTSTEPFFKYKGLLGAFWEKGPLHPKSKNDVTPAAAYDIPTEMERFKTRCHRQKGIMLSNPRERPATSRFMVNDPGLCYRRPEDPAPNSYYPRNHEMFYNVAQPTEFFGPNPHRFYRRLTVPYLTDSLVRPHVGFSPGPGRYENRYRDICHCRAELTLMPGIELMIMKQKRFKFRRLPFDKIKRGLFCTPEWRHIKGKGWRYLFTRPPKIETKISQSAKKSKRLQKDLKLYAESKYITMINTPKRKTQYVLDKNLKFKPPRIEFNSLPKLFIKKHRMNKKIAFSSGQDRFPEEPAPLPLTESQLAKIKSKLPPERQLQDYPVMNKRPSEIKSKLLEMPEHMRPMYHPILRKSHYKFSALPGTKVLVSTSDVRTPEDGECSRRDFNARDYFRPLEQIDPRYRNLSISAGNF